MKYIVLVITFFTLFTASALGSNTGLSHDKPLREAIREAIVYPRFAIEEGIQGKVDMTLQVRADGRIEIIKATSNNDKLLGYTLRIVASLEIQADLNEVDQPFTMSINFELM